MGLKRQTLVSEAVRVLAEPLGTLGYSLVSSPPADHHEFWLEKKPTAPSEYFRIIEFQPSGLSKYDLFDLTVNLWRRTYRGDEGQPSNNPFVFDPSVNLWRLADRGDDEQRSDRPLVTELLARLSPWLRQPGMEHKEYWWHFTTVNELRQAYADILQLLLASGIAFLEDAAPY
jgi:hypothetical protein